MNWMHPYKYDVIPSSVSLGFLHSVLFLILLDCSLLLASNFINYGTRVELCFYLSCGQENVSFLVDLFSSYPAAFGFLASLPVDNMTLNPANKRTDQSLYDFQTGIGVVAHATLDTEQLISHSRTALVDTITSLQGFDGGLIAASEVHKLLRFMTLWSVLDLYRLVIQLIF